MLNFDWLSGIPPSVARGVFLTLFIVIGILILLVPNEEIYSGLENPRWWHNLKIWSWLVLSIIFLTYLAF